VRAVIDYRPALRERSGVGEYAYELVRALLRTCGAGAREHPLELSVFSSSWKDRLALPGELAGATPIDRAVPGVVLNFAWHRLGWPAAETLMRRAFDVTHSLHPLLMPARNAAQVVTIHDLNFLAHPERTRAEIRRDYPALAGDHARRADRIVVPSHFTAREVERQLGVAPDKIAVCSPGAPTWTPRTAAPTDGYVLFFGTLEPRKNVGALLDAWERVLTRPAEPGRPVPELVLAGKATSESGAWLDRLLRPPLQGAVRHIGYVDPANRQALYDRARLLVQPSFEEGFGIPVLEAMTRGVPVVAANRGALPEVLGDAGLLVDPHQPEQLAAAIERMLWDDSFTAAAASKGVERSKLFSWDRTARLVYETYEQAIDHRHRCGSA
jgi:glycosyltransferase involved in cell wall biosynthesis